MNKPNFLLIGAPRCGTTWIAMNLIHHPEIYIPSQKELHYFDWNLEKGLSWYKEQFEGTEKYQLVGEATPSYLALENSPELIKNALGTDIKFIVCLRDPVERLYSRYWNTMAKYKHNEGKSFQDRIKEKPGFIEEGKYARHLDSFFSVFEKDQFHICFYEDLMNTPSNFLKEILEFLGASTEFDPPRLTHKVNSASSKKRLGRSDTLYYISRVLKRLKLFGLMNRVESLNRVNYPEMEEGIRKFLIQTEYKIHNERLQELTGRDLSAWNAY